MQVAAQTSKKQLWAGYSISALPALFMLVDGITHILQIAPVVEAMNQLGYPLHHAVTLGIIAIICVALYVVPATSVIGAILLTGYLGGAIAANLRIDAPLFSNVLFPLYVGILVWVGLYLRNEKLRALVSFRG